MVIIVYIVVGNIMFGVMVGYFFLCYGFEFIIIVYVFFYIGLYLIFG